MKKLLCNNDDDPAWNIVRIHFHLYQDTAEERVKKLTKMCKAVGLNKRKSCIADYLDCPFNIDKYDCKDITEEMWREKFETFK